jgi:predicted ATPase with chaperone activity
MTLINAGAPRLQPVLKVGRTITDLAGSEDIQPVVSHAKTIQQKT